MVPPTHPIEAVAAQPPGNRVVTIEASDELARILVVTSGWPHREDPTNCVFVKRQVDSLRMQGLESDVMFIRGYRSKSAYVLAALQLAAWNLTRRDRYDLVHCHSGEAALAAAFFRRAPLLVSYMGGDLLHDSTRADGRVTWSNRLRCWVIRHHSRLAAATITKSREMAAALPRAAGARNHVVPNGVDTGHFRPLDHAEARRRLGWDQAWRVALYVGDPDELRKGYPLAADAVARAAQMLDGVRLEVVHRVDPEVVPVFMSAADCLVLLSRMEGSPNVVKEALMCNLPVIATAVGDVPELLERVSPSFIVSPHLDAVASALVACLRAPSRSNGRCRSQHLAVGAIADRVVEIYARLAPQLVSPGSSPARRREACGLPASQG